MRHDMSELSVDNALNENIPVQYRKGKASFLDIDVSVDPRVFIPRPETGVLVKVVCETCRKEGWDGPRILELGTGSGIIPISLARRLPGVRITAVDISRDALAVAADNINAFGVSGRIDLLESDMFDSLGQGYTEIFDVIVSNPPYVSEPDLARLDVWVKAEPEIALLSGDEGMDHLMIIASRSRRYLKKGGMVAVEVGYDQAEKVKRAFRENGLEEIASFRDEAGHERVITGRKNG
ncbi:MAG: peptide chain release factor N(5)-glutamine methyltransferase [Candidatus Omnitrophica bacterium]|nr:peptide chain release factor N(5)-glutamine methyltransferase [Candidatus Omnitrophota bacterium]